MIDETRAAASSSPRRGGDPLPRRRNGVNLLKAVPLTVGIAVSLSSCSGSWQVSSPRPKKNTAVVVSSVESLLQGNVDPLYDNLYPEEVRGMGLTRESVRSLCDALILPRLRMGRPEGAMIVQVDGNTLDAMAVQRLRDGKNTPGDFGLTAEVTPQGPKVSLIDALVASWLLAKEFEKGRYLDGMEKRHAVLEGIQHDRKRLEALGIRKVVRVPTDPPVTLAEWEKIVRAKIDQQERVRRERSGG